MTKVMSCIHQKDYWEEVCSRCDGDMQCKVPYPQTTEFFVAMVPPTATHQEKQVNWKTKTFYEPTELKAARSKLVAHLGQHVPEQKYTRGVRLVTKWCFPITGKHKDGEYRITKPDTDNMVKLLKDCMTDLGFWTDDALVASEIIEKFWADVPGIYIRIEELI